MTYRDELKAALSRVDALEGELKALRGQKEVRADDVPALQGAHLGRGRRPDSANDAAVEQFRAELRRDRLSDLRAIDDEEELQVELHRALLWTAEEMRRSREAPETHQALVALAEALLARWDLPGTPPGPTTARWLDGVPLNAIRLPELRKLLGAIDAFYASHG